MKNLTKWLNANKILPGVKKLVIFKHMKKKLECPTKTKLSREGIYLPKSVKYLCVKTAENLNWKDQSHEIAAKLEQLHWSKNYVSFNTLKAIDFAIFDLHINYANLIWGQNPNFKL